jgi:hypothetical protein
MGITPAFTPFALIRTAVATRLSFILARINERFNIIFQCLLTPATRQAAESTFNHPAGFTLILFSKFLTTASR